MLLPLLPVPMPLEDPNKLELEGVFQLVLKLIPID